VRKVPKMAPAVPTAEKLPTTAPVSSSERSRILTTMGVTALRAAAGRKKAPAARVTISTGPAARMEGPRRWTIGGENRASTPAATRSGPNRTWGSTRSALRPPSHAPTEMPASTVPMIPVNVSSVIPT
jgi:hypothetical protein